ncbi:uncharacterized protein DDB_G0290301-like isoform X2 [Oreochromis aureus]|uniref:uncharacterized protein DDB_G0290301-like isoform X2 n=1 Tax=Oreochromis aureus TaxID=47969 RepID=UPI001953A5F2|nr:uncharacterized protein DDB_G0290301-like isoform X2 [Oreochromis aureus]
MQWTQRNVPVYLRGQQQADERALEKLLLLKQQERDEQYMEEEQVKLKERRERAKQNSFIFPARPLTPPRSIQQHRYMNELQIQRDRRQKFKAQGEQERRFMECLDQIHLTKGVALQQAQQLQRKREKAEQYKRALDTQMSEKKCTEPPDCHPDSSTFSRCEKAACKAESRERAQKIFQVNFSAATERTKELHNHQAQLEKEKEMLRRN